MTTLQRQNVRAALLAAGFRRTTSGDKKCHYDRKLDGAYTEEWTHTLDKTRIICKWDKKTKPDDDIRDIIKANQSAVPLDRIDLVGGF